MNLLLILTLIYAGVLVAALAATLIVVLVLLRQISSTLAEVETSLSTVRERTRSIEQFLTQLQDPCNQCPGELQRAEEDLEKIKNRLTAILERGPGVSIH
jgi:septal ring factor EnvC (AmiA/AmiB activator)